MESETTAADTNILILFMVIVFLYVVHNIIIMSNPAPEKKTIMICDDERDLLQLFGLAHDKLD